MNQVGLILLVSGPLGAGKTSLCQLMHERLGYSIISGDSIFGPLEKNKLDWDARQELSWNWIVEQTREKVSRSEHVVIDIVVEDELQWFLSQVSDLRVQIKYIVLVADEETLKERLEKRDGGQQFFSRSKKLLHQLESDPTNKKHLLDTSNKSSEQVLNEILSDLRFNL